MSSTLLLLILCVCHVCSPHRPRSHHRVVHPGELCPRVCHQLECLHKCCADMADNARRTAPSCTLKVPPSPPLILVSSCRTKPNNTARSSRYDNVKQTPRDVAKRARVSNASPYFVGRAIDEPFAMGPQITLVPSGKDQVCIEGNVRCGRSIWSDLCSGICSLQAIRIGEPTSI